MKTRPRIVSAALLLILVDGLGWLAFALIVAFGLHRGLPHNELVRWIVALLAFASALALPGLAFLLARRVRFAFYLTVALLGLIAVLSITDEVGLPDLIVLLLTVAPLALLLAARGWFLPRSR